MTYAIQWLRLLVAFVVIYIIATSASGIYSIILLQETGYSFLQHIDAIDVIWGFVITTNIILLSWVFFCAKLYKRHHRIKRKSPLRIIVVHIIVLSAIYEMVLLFTGDANIAGWVIVIMTAGVGIARFLVLENLIYRDVTPDTTYQQ